MQLRDGFHGVACRGNLSEVFSLINLVVQFNSEINKKLKMQATRFLKKIVSMLTSINLGHFHDECQISSQRFDEFSFFRGRNFENIFSAHN